MKYIYRFEKLFFLSISILFFPNLAAVNGPRFYEILINGKKILVGYLPFENDDIQSGKQVFLSGAFQFPKLLSKAADEKKQCILLLPEDYDGHSPIGQLGPWSEGVRLALTSASMYFRFSTLGNVDVRICLYGASLSQHDIKNVVKKISEIKLTRDASTSIEMEFEKRIFKLRDLEISPQEADLVLMPLNFDYHTPFKSVLRPNLPKKEEDLRFLITGGAGFIGSHLAELLLSNGHQVIVLDNLFTCSSENINELLKKYPNQCEFFKHDICMPFNLEGHLTHVVHFASLPSPEYYYKFPLETLNTGIIGTKNALEIALQKNAAFLFASSSEVYGDPEISPQTEDYVGRVSAWGMRSQYDESKRGGEALIKLYFDEFGLDVRVVRIFNTYGPRMNINDGRVITNFVRAFIQSKPMVIYGDGKQTRSFAYVSDTVNGIFKVLMSLDLAKAATIADRIFNLGNPQENTILELATKVNECAQAILHLNVPITFIKSFDPSDPKKRKPDITKIFQRLAFEPQICLEKGLEKTFQYFFKSQALHGNTHSKG